MTPARFVQQRLLPAFLSVTALAMPLAAVAQMHRVAKPDQVTRAVGVYEYVGDPAKPRAARLIPVSLFIGGHFEDAGVYLARPIPFALDTGFRYELQQGGQLQNYLDLVAARNFASSSVAASIPYDDGWFGYGRVVSPKAEKAARLKPNCGNAHVVEDAPAKTDGKPHFGTKPAESAKPVAGPDPCREEDRPEKVTLQDDRKTDSADPERPTLHRSPESSANNTGSAGKPDKKAPKPPPATITANSSPGDDPDRPTIRRRAVDEEDPNAIPPDPRDLASREAAPKPASTSPAVAADARSTANQTVTEEGSITSGDTMSGGPRLRRGKPADAPHEAPPVAAKPVHSANPAALAVPAPLEALVAVSDAKDRPAHDFRYNFASNTERASALSALQELAREVVRNPALAKGAAAVSATSQEVEKPSTTAVPRSAAARSARGHTGAAHSTHAATSASAAGSTFQLADEEMHAYELYYSAPITYTYFARVPASPTTPERFVTVIATTDPDGKLQPALRTVTDAAHMDRVPRYRPIDVVDADGSNRASLLIELRSQQSRQFALYRLLGNRPDQIFVSGSTLL